MPATSEILARTSGDFQASYVKGARLQLLDKQLSPFRVFAYLRWAHSPNHMLVEG